MFVTFKFIVLLFVLFLLLCLLWWDPPETGIPQEFLTLMLVHSLFPAIHQNYYLNIPTRFMLHRIFCLGFPGPVLKNPIEMQEMQRHRFNPWVGNDPLE